MNWFLEKMRLYSVALSGIDDPTGEHLHNLEARVRHLESEIARLGGRLDRFPDAPPGYQDASGKEA
ncbi:hypothetical protein [Microvirga zambiensis]|uniref:hypothetical protein n=1 Tax=Microvirga zambiensis TaxID=1402137 RepID=UPI00191D90A6|nr:hypothetical protein [Microvirga zambiensis]